MADTWETTKEQQWEEYKELYQKQEFKGRVVADRPAHTVTSLPERQLPPNPDHIQFPALINPQGVRYSKHGDLLVTLTIPAQYSQNALNIVAMMSKLCSVDLVPYPRFNPDQELSEQGNWTNEGWAS